MNHFDSPPSLSFFHAKCRRATISGEDQSANQTVFGAVAVNACFSRFGAIGRLWRLSVVQGLTRNDQLFDAKVVPVSIAPIKYDLTTHLLSAEEDAFGSSTGMEDELRESLGRSIRIIAEERYRLRVRQSL